MNPLPFKYNKRGVTMENNICAECGSNEMIETTDTMEVEVKGKILVIENLKAEKCLKCGEVYYNPEVSKFIDNQIKIFKAEGFENKAKEITKQKGLTQEKLGELLGGLTRQRVNQILQDDNLDVRTMYKVANAVNEPVLNLFTFNRIVEKDHKFYIENE